MFLELVQSRAVLWNLVLREVRVRYKQTYLGVAWALFVPLSMMLTLTFVFTKVMDLGQMLHTSMPYPIFAYIGLLPWTFFAQSVTGATNSLVANRNLVTKIYFPREVLPISAVLSCLFDFVIAAGVLVVLIGYFQFFTAWSFSVQWTLLMVPGVFLVQLMFTLGLGLWLSLANLFYRDVKYVVTVGLQMMMFLTNVIYPLESGNPTIQAIIYCNPMTPIIDAYRRCIIHGQGPDPLPFAMACVISFLLLSSGWWVFHRTEPRFAESI